LKEQKLSVASIYADQILRLMGDQRFCRAIVKSSSRTALEFFLEMNKTKKYTIKANVFCGNIVREALRNKESFLYYETEGYESGLIGYHKPLSQAIFSNYRMVEEIGSLLDAGIEEYNKWDAAQWEAYCRIVLISFQNYVQEWSGTMSSSLARAFGRIELAMADLYMLNGKLEINWNDDLQKRLRVIVEFVQKAIRILEEKGVPSYLRLRVRKKYGSGTTIYDELADVIFNIISCAASIKSPADVCWWIQHNYVWDELFTSLTSNGPAAKAIRFKVRRLLYNEIVEMRTITNYQGARILGFCLNVMGFRPVNEEFARGAKPLQRAVLSWTKKNYAWLYSYHPSLGKACLVDTITYEKNKFRLVKAYDDIWRREPEYIYFDVDQPKTEETGIQEITTA